MSSVLGSIFSFGDSLKRRLRDAASNPSNYATMTADQNQREWARNPDERSMGFFNPVPLGTMGNFALRKELADALPSLSRRDFMKKSAGIAGGTAALGIPGAKLLQKFAPEEKQLVKEATAKQAAVESAPKYKYNSLKDYLDDVHTNAEDSVYYLNEGEPNLRLYTNIYKRRLLDDEKYYNEFKDYSKLKVGTRPATREESARELARQRMYDQFDPPGVHEGAAEDILQAEKDWMAREDKWTGNIKKQMDERLDAFSPQAKEEMKAFKNRIDFNNKNGFTGAAGERHWTDSDIIDGLRWRLDNP